MLFLLPSFLVGYGAGIATGVMWPRLRPIALELATAGYRLADAIAVAAARKREDLQDILAEARAHARTAYSPSRPS